jgi:hypothetical protein
MVVSMVWAVFSALAFIYAVRWMSVSRAFYEYTRNNGSHAAARGHLASSVALLIGASLNTIAGAWGVYYPGRLSTGTTFAVMLGVGCLLFPVYFYSRQLLGADIDRTKHPTQVNIYVTSLLLGTAVLFITVLALSGTQTQAAPFIYDQTHYEATNPQLCVGEELYIPFSGNLDLDSGVFLLFDNVFPEEAPTVSVASSFEYRGINTLGKGHLESVYLYEVPLHLEPGRYTLLHQNAYLQSNLTHGFTTDFEVLECK